jgi:hypothetical protein
MPYRAMVRQPFCVVWMRQMKLFTSTHCKCSDDIGGYHAVIMEQGRQRGGSDGVRSVIT